MYLILNQSEYDYSFSEQDLSQIQDLQHALDRIYFIAEPIYRQQVHNYPDYREIKGERKETAYVDFLAFLAKQTLGYFKSCSLMKSERLHKHDASRDSAESAGLRIDNQHSFPSVVNLLGNEHNNVQFCK